MYDDQKFSENALSAARNATGWICPDCGELALAQTGYCKVCTVHWECLRCAQACDLLNADLATRVMRVMDSFCLKGKIGSEHAREIIEILADELGEVPPGVSQWKNTGIHYGYDKYFKIKWPK